MTPGTEEALSWCLLGGAEGDGADCGPGSWPHLLAPDHAIYFGLLLVQLCAGPAELLTGVLQAPGQQLYPGLQLTPGASLPSPLTAEMQPASWHPGSSMALGPPLDPGPAHLLGLELDLHMLLVSTESLQLALKVSLLYLSLLQAGPELLPLLVQAV